MAFFAGSISDMASSMVGSRQSPITGEFARFNSSMLFLDMAHGTDIDAVPLPHQRRSPVDDHARIVPCSKRIDEPSRRIQFRLEKVPLFHETCDLVVIDDSGFRGQGCLFA